MRIGVTNAVLSNTGDAAIYQGILDSLAAVGVTAPEDVVVFDSDAAVTSRLYPHWQVFQQLTVSPPREPARLRGLLQRFRYYWVRQLVEQNALVRSALRWPGLRNTRFAMSFSALAACDIVISSGGTYLVDHYDFEPRILEFTLVRRLGADLVLWTQSMGPFASDRALGQIERAAELVDRVYFRDRRSLDSWRRANGQAKPLSVVPDVVFALDIPQHAVPPNGNRPPTAMMSVRAWSRGTSGEALSMKQYEAMMRTGSERLLAAGWGVTAMSTCQGVPSYAYDDSKEALRVFRGTQVAVNRGFHTPLQLLTELEGADLVVSTRMHLAILAILSGRPVIAVAYEFKTLELFASLGLADFAVAIEDASPEWLASRLDLLMSDPSRAVLDETRLADLRARAMTPAIELATRIRAGALR